MKRFMLSVVCFIICICNFSIVLAGTTFEDLANTKYENAVSSLTEENVINGMPDGSYDAYSNVTRAQLAKMLVEALDLKQGSSNVSFSDVESHWAIDYIKTASANKIVNGYQDGTFRPEANVTYAEAVTMVMRAIGKDVGINTDANWYDNYVNEASKNNLLTNITEVEAEENLNRGDTALLIYNMLNLPKEEISNDEFTLSFLKLENKKENIVYSPLSIKYALNMLNEGAEGETKAEIEKIIKDLKLNKYENIAEKLSLANGVYIREKYKTAIKDEYITALSKNYNAEVKYDSFANANNINKWIEEKTLGIIKNLLNDNTVKDGSVIMLLINALAIDMEWENDFDCEDTYGRKFYLADGTTMEATTMSKTTKSDSIAFYKDEEVSALSMNLKKYDDTQLEFIAIMPEENLDKYVEKTSMKEINTIISKMKPASSEETKDGLRITIPKFKYDYSLELKEDLMGLGIEKAFYEKVADFSKISDEIEFFVGDAIHKADIEFSEEGVKAAAVTVFIMCGATAIERPPVYVDMNIDNPFMYLIRDKANGEVWFVGTVYTPNLWTDDMAEYEPF